MDGQGSTDEHQIIHNDDDDELPKGIRSHTRSQQARSDIVMTTRIAPPSASEKNDHRAVRCRTRRERPQKLRIVGKDQDGADGATNTQLNLYEPDIESFVSACIPGVSFGTGTDNDDGRQRRTKSIRKRSLPLLSFLSSTHLADAQKKRKKEEHERQNAIAEEEAKKALLLNPIIPTTLGSDTLGTERKPAPNNSGFREGFVGLGRDATIVNQTRVTSAGESSDPQEVTTTTVTTTMEKASNILMPPLLKEFLTQLESCPR